MLLSFVYMRNQSRDTAGDRARGSTHVDDVVVSSFLLGPEVALACSCTFLGLHFWTEGLNMPSCELQIVHSSQKRTMEF
jgi:hypothetical protein